jgi:hypothetical protein
VVAAIYGIGGTYELVVEVDFDVYGTIVTMEKLGDMIQG